MIRQSFIANPPLVPVSSLAYEEQAWLAYDVADSRREVGVMGINEYRARVAGGIALSLPAWRVRVRPALRSLSLA